jgi:hypothetical protein
VRLDRSLGSTVVLLCAAVGASVHFPPHDGPKQHQFKNCPRLLQSGVTPSQRENAVPLMLEQPAVPVGALI